MEEWEARDRRKSVRFPVSILLKCQCADEKKEDASCTRDISIKGMGIITNERFTLGSSLDICLTMPDNGEEIQAKGKIVWENTDTNNPGEYRLGVHLEEASLKPIPLVLRTMQVRRQ